MKLNARYIGYDIINGKGSTEFGIGAACAVDAETALNGTVPCPNGGEMLEFEVEGAEDDE